MVNYQATQLDAVFKALSDPTRRGILEMLSNGVNNVRTLAAPYKMSLPAISKHLRVLEKAGLIKRERRGQEHLISVQSQAVTPAKDWITHYTTLWNNQFDAVENYLKQQQQQSATSIAKEKMENEKHDK